MPFRLRKKLWIIPPFLYLNASNSGLSWTLKIGAWSRNSRTGRNRVDLPGPISWVGRTRGQRAVIRERRRGRREQRQAHRAGRNAERAKEREQKAEHRRQERQKWDTYWRERSAPRPEQKDAPIVGTIINRTDGTSAEQRNSAGLCGQRTHDGTPCQRRGRCAPGTHARRRR